MERRRFSRKEVNLKAVCRPLGSPGAEITATAVDISKGGIGLKSDKPLDTRGKVSITVYGSSGHESISGSGKVAWQFALPSGEIRTGIEFTSIAWTECENFLRRV
ncbi:MAG: PilZ domain-containing protein [Candidatus Omnitrophota bacterium]